MWAPHRQLGFVCIHIILFVAIVGSGLGMQFPFTINVCAREASSLEHSLNQPTKRVMDDTDGDKEEQPAQHVQCQQRERKRRQRLKESKAKRHAGNGAEGCSTLTCKRSALLASKRTAMRKARSAELSLSKVLLQPLHVHALKLPGNNALHVHLFPEI